MKREILFMALLTAISTIILSVGIVRYNFVVISVGMIGMFLSLYFSYRVAPKIPSSGREYIIASALVVYLLGEGVFLFFFAMTFNNWLLLMECAMILILGYTIYWRGN